MKTTKWVSDALHSELNFKIKHLMISNVSGSFRNFNVNVATQGDDFTKAEIELSADMSSINTNNEQRDAHLQNADFFEAEKYPQLNFRSTKMEKVDNESFTLYGDLTLKGITKPVKLNVEYSGVTKDPWGTERVGFSVTGKINRSEWDVSFNKILETGGLGLGEEVKINSEIQMVKQVATVTV